jgi:hypothetical protein
MTFLSYTIQYLLVVAYALLTYKFGLTLSEAASILIISITIGIVGDLRKNENNNANRDQ